MKPQKKENNVKRVTLHTPTVNAKGNLHASGQIEVLAGSVMKDYTEKEMAKMRAVFSKLVSQGVISVKDGKARFDKTHSFQNANEAASLLLHRGGDNAKAWHAADYAKEKTKPAPKKDPVKKQNTEKKQETKQEKKPAAKKKHEPKKAGRPAEKKQTPATKKSAFKGNGKTSHRKDPRNPRGIKPQGREAEKAAQQVQRPGYIQFAGMGQHSKVKH